MPKILVSPEIKKKFDKAHAALRKPQSKKSFATVLVTDGMAKLEKTEPPGDPVRVVPRANGNRTIEYDDADIAKPLIEFKVSKQYSNVTTAARACLYSSLKIDAQQWLD